MIALEEEMRLYNVSTLFTSIPVDKALVVMKDRLVNYIILKNRTPLSREDHKTMELCLKCTYFLFQDQYYLQIHGVAIGSPV